MKTISAFLLTLLITFQSFAGDWNNIRSGQPLPGQKILVSSNIDQSVIHFRLDGFITEEISTPQGPAVVISLEGATPMLVKGAPDLPKMTASVIIPDLALMQVEVTEALYRDFENVFIAPSKGNLTRDIDPSMVPYEFGKEYTTNAFFPGEIAGARDPYIVRDYRGQTVIAYPFQYNPVTRTLRVYTDITVKMSRVNDLGLNPLYRTEPLEAIDADFNNIYQSHFLNAEGNGSRYTPVPEYGNMLIIAYGAFLDAIQPYSDWKEQIGYPVEIVDVGSIGNSNAIKTYIANYYNTNGLTFVLLVGDAAQVPPSSTSAGDSDNNYAYIVGNDHYPDLFIGRFSAENVGQVETQVARTLMYEQNPPLSGSWLSVCTGIASDQGPGDDGEMDYQHIRNIGNNKLIPFSYTYANELFDGSQGGNDAGGSPTPSTVATAVNAGTGIINYTGHGSDGSWGTSGFSISDVNNLTNDNLLPFVWSVACVNGNFVGQTCFAEAWLRATHNGQPTGAVAFLGSTINQSWDPPMAGQDEMNDVMVESYSDQINRTFGALSMHGCMQMNDEFGGGGSEMTDTWVCFGDPSLMVRTAMPLTMTVTHDPIIFLGSTQLTVYCNVDGARATLSMDGERLSTDVVTNGSVVLEFAPLGNIGTATLTITGFNCLPYISNIDVVPATGPYVVMDTYQIIDTEGNNNGLADYNESLDLSVSLENVGVIDATDVQVTLATEDPYIIITDYHEIFPLIPAGQSVSIDNAFSVVVSSDVPDQHSVMFSLTSVSGEETWQSTFVMVANAPILHINAMTIDDSELGNGDGELDPGESADLTINYSNSGHATAYDVNVSLEGQSGFIKMTNPLQNFPSIGFLGVFNKTFMVTVDESTPEGIRVNFANELSMGDYFQEKVFAVKISPKVENFETGDLSQYNWQTGGNVPWDIISTYPYEGFYCLKSGTITHNQTSEISLTYNVMSNDSIIFYRKVSSETSDMLKFYINNTMMEDWSGTTGGWKREAFAVSPGMKTFKWVYQKNNMGSAGSDCAWLDYIILPSPMALTIWAGPDDKTCEGFSYNLNESYGTDYNTIEWATSGSGVFDDNTVMHPVYNPSSADMSEGEVVLTLSLTDNEGHVITDELNLGFTVVPEAPGTPEGPANINLTQVQVSEYSITEVEGADEYFWSLDPVEAGVIIVNETMATVNWNTEFTGTAYLTATAGNSCGTGNVSEALAIEVENSIVDVPEIDGSGFTVSVYPNPASGKLQVSTERTEGEQTEVRIVNTLGITVFSGSNFISGEIISIPVNHLQPGIYFITVTCYDHKVTRKVLIR